MRLILVHTTVVSTQSLGTEPTGTQQQGDYTNNGGRLLEIPTQPTRSETHKSAYERQCGNLRTISFVISHFTYFVLRARSKETWLSFVDDTGLKK